MNLTYLHLLLNNSHTTSIIFFFLSPRIQSSRFTSAQTAVVTLQCHCRHLLPLPQPDTLNLHGSIYSTFYPPFPFPPLILISLLSTSSGKLQRTLSTLALKAPSASSWHNASPAVTGLHGG